jgi:enoyl-CoA hydratase/carnithine racemase
MPNSALTRLEIDGPIATLTLDRPARRNAIATAEDCDAVVTALITVRRQDGVACLILTGAGSAFCADGDLQALHSGQGIGPRSRPDQTRQNYERGGRPGRRRSCSDGGALMRALQFATYPTAAELRTVA